MRGTTRHRTGRVSIAIALICAALLSACGHRMSEQQLLRANSRVLSGTTNGGSDGGGADNSGGANPEQSTASNPQVATGGGGGDATSGGGISSGGGAAPGAGGGGTASGAGACSTTQGGPIPIGSVGNYSGLAAGSIAPALQALRAWNKHLNDTGGLCGRQVQLIVADDAGDPAKHVAALHDLVENRHVVAFVFNAAPLTAQSGRSYLESVNVPVIGTDGTLTFEYQSPVFFSVGSSRDSLIFGAMRNGVVYGHAPKVALFYCAEAAQCKEANDRRNELASRTGAQVVFSAQVSLAQPDFTSECRQAQQAGAQSLYVALDTTGVHRVAQSCARQNYYPTFLGFSATVVYEFKDDPGIKRLLWNGQVFPFVGTENPARADFHRVMDAYLGRPASPGDAGAWVSGKAFELAVTRAANSAHVVTPSSLLDALHTFRNETLAGLTVPLTFAAGQPQSSVDCWFSADLQDGVWHSVNNGQPTCL
jgi:branched-chain amino acid transport system substrate-binding protein